MYMYMHMCMIYNHHFPLEKMEFWKLVWRQKDVKPWDTLLHSVCFTSLFHITCLIMHVLKYKKQGETYLQQAVVFYGALAWGSKLLETLDS